ncbi:hypothetical protein ARMGADRAFT_932501, partial [Armillaria gallica]
LCSEASLFVRPPKNSDQNALDKRKPSDSNDSPSLPDDTSCALITVTIYTKGSSTTMRTSQHAFLSSQTLGDIIEAMPCASNDLPKEIVSHSQVANQLAVNASSGSVVCIEDVLYGDGMSETDYADKMLQCLAARSTQHRALTKAPESMHDTSLSSLPLRINEPYWILHQGNCEHFFVVDQIRHASNLSDPSSRYPFTLQLTPISLDLCRACYRIPAIWSIVRDLRLGESPCILCGSCWENMGEPDDGVVVVPLPKYELGW